MSTWRQKAIDAAPELKKELEAPDCTIYTAFFDLLPVLRTAHENNDQQRLQLIYDFAEWCMQQKAKDLWNAAGVAFYEHLGDEDSTYPAFTQWVKKETYAGIRGLLHMRLSDDKMKFLDSFYSWKNQPGKTGKKKKE